MQTSVELDRWFNLGHYYEYRKDFSKALDCFLNYYKLDQNNEIITNKIRRYGSGINLAKQDINLEGIEYDSIAK